jgi:transglutaminase-like putative cysteine protease
MNHPETRRSRGADDDARKWAFLQRAPEEDARAPELQHVAQALQAASLGDQDRFAALCMAMARDGVRYQLDTERTGSEDIAGYTRPKESPIEILARGVDDCDGKARLFCGLAIAGGLRARMVPHWREGTLRHVSAEVWRGGQWVPVEPTAKRARMGETYRQVPKGLHGEIET